MIINCPYCSEPLGVMVNLTEPETRMITCHSQGNDQDTHVRQQRLKRDDAKQYCHKEFVIHTEPSAPEITFYSVELIHKEF